VWINRSADSTDGKYVFTFSFPEDMDTSSATKPTISIFYAKCDSTYPPKRYITVDTAKSYWTNGYTYQMTVTIPGTGGANWSDTAKPWAAPYYALSVAGMKDASGIPITNWGTVGGANNGRTRAHAIISMAEGTPPVAWYAQIRGPVNLLGLKDF
jgi:hypothetical protein